MLGGERRESLGTQERDVAVDHEQVVFAVDVEGADGERHAHRVAGAALHALLDELDGQIGDELLLHRLGDFLGAAPDHHDDALDRELHEGVEHVQQHRAAAERVQHLGSGRPHARALARCEYHGRERSVG